MSWLKIYCPNCKREIEFNIKNLRKWLENAKHRAEMYHELINVIEAELGKKAQEDVEIFQSQGIKTAVSVD